MLTTTKTCPEPLICAPGVTVPHDVSGVHDEVPVGQRPLQVRDLMTTELITVPPELPVFEARQRMEAQRIRHLLVASADGALEGLVTDRDIRLNLPSPATSLSVWELNYLLATLTVGQVMKRSLVTTWPEASVADAARVMLTHKFGALPVVDAGRVVGIITETDFVRGFVPGEMDARTARHGGPRQAGKETRS
jgi:acetoin utilization protein AcuB